MANSTMAAPIKKHKPISEETLAQLTVDDVKSFGFILDHVIGEKKQCTNIMLPPVIGARLRPREEIMVTKVFESCTFKATASGVVGRYNFDMKMGNIPTRSH